MPKSIFFRGSEKDLLSGLTVLFMMAPLSCNSGTHSTAGNSEKHVKDEQLSTDQIYQRDVLTDAFAKQDLQAGNVVKISAISGLYAQKYSMLLNTPIDDVELIVFEPKSGETVDASLSSSVSPRPSLSLVGGPKAARVRTSGAGAGGDREEIEQTAPAITQAQIGEIMGELIRLPRTNPDNPAAVFGTYFDEQGRLRGPMFIEYLKAQGKGLVTSAMLRAACEEYLLDLQPEEAQAPRPAVVTARLPVTPAAAAAPSLRPQGAILLHVPESVAPSRRDPRADRITRGFLGALGSAPRGQQPRRPGQVVAGAIGAVCGLVDCVFAGRLGDTLRRPRRESPEVIFSGPP